MNVLDRFRMSALDHAPWERLAEADLGAALRVPTMLSPAEQKLYFWLTAFWADGAGEVVDLGCFAGGSTARLAEGHRVAALRSGVHGFDRFTVDPALKEDLLYRQGVAPFAGDDILPLARALLAPWSDRVRLHRGEIDRVGWTGGPIEILVMDASKTAWTMDRMSRTFFPHLLPGRSLLVQQDYLHWSQPWVPAQMELLSVHFRPVAHVARDTMVYLCTSPPGLSALNAARTQDLSDEDLVSLLQAAQARFERFGGEVTGRLQVMERALRSNPGERAAHRFRKP